MYKAEFEKLLQKGFKEKNFILFGESSFFIDRYAQILSNIEDANILSLYYDEYEFTQAKAHISQASLFGGTNILIIKSDKKIPKKELENLFELSNKGDNRFIFAYFGSDYKSYNNAFKKFGVITVRFFYPNHNEAIKILIQEAQQLQLNIDNYTLNHLLNLQNNNLEFAINELQKLSIFQNQKITNKELDNLVFGMGEVDLNSVFKNIIYKKEFIEDIESILEHGEDEIRIISSLCSFINELFLFNAYIRINGIADAKAILGYNPPQFIVKEKSSMAMKIKPEIYYKIIKELQQSELEMKSSNTEKKSLLYSTLLSIAKIL